MIKYLSLFSGIGSPEQALKNIGVDYELIGFSEIDKYAVQSYCAVHGADPMLDDLGDITKIDIESLPVDEIDLVTHGSPCQDFSVAGNNKGGDEGSGTRSSLMWNTVAICEHCKPKYVIWENVKNVLSKKHKHNFDKYISEMDRIGYDNYYKVLNAKDFGVPQNRERVFVVSIRKDLDQSFIFPTGWNSGIKLKDVLEDKVDERYYVSSEKVQQLIKNCNGVIDLNKQVIGTCHKKNNLSFSTRDKVYSEEKEAPTLTATMYKDATKIIVADYRYDEGLRIRKEGNSPCLTRQVGNTGLSGNPLIIYKVREATKKGYTIAGEGDSINLEQPNSTTRRGRVGKQIANTLNTSNHQAVVQNYRIRKLTPLECWRLMGFKDEQFRKAEAVCSNSQLYKQAGNSIVVNVMEEIFKELFKEELR